MPPRDLHPDGRQSSSHTPPSHRGSQAAAAAEAETETEVASPKKRDNSSDPSATTNTTTSSKSSPSSSASKTSNRQKTAAPPPPDGGWGWMVVLSSFTLSVLVDGVCFSVGIFFTPLRHYFGSSKADTAWVGSVLNGSYLIIGPVVSAFVNRFGCRRVAMFGSIFASISIFISTLSPNLPTLIITFGMLGGMGFGFVYLPAIVMVGYYFERRRALATGIACCGSGIGAFVFAPLCNVLLEQYGWKGATWILSGLVLNALVFSIFYRPLEDGVTPRADRDDATSVENGEARSSEQKRALLSDYSKGGGGKEEEEQGKEDHKDGRRRLTSGEGRDVTSVPGQENSLSISTDNDVTEKEKQKEDVIGSRDATIKEDQPLRHAIPDIIVQTSEMFNKDGGMAGRRRIEGGNGEEDEMTLQTITTDDDDDTTRTMGVRLSDLIQTVTPSIPRSDKAADCKAYLSAFQLTALHDNDSSVARMAFSHDALGPNSNVRKRSANSHRHHHDHHYHRHQHQHHHHHHNHLEVDNPLRRKDIFYSGSLRNIPEYQSSQSLSEYRRKVTKSDEDGSACSHDEKKGKEDDDDDDDQEGDSEGDRERRGRRHVLRRVLCDPLCAAFDLSLLTSPTFVIYGLSCALCMAGFFVPFVYLPTLSMDLGTPSTQAAFLVSIIGIANTIGRVIVGFVSDLPWADGLLINNIALIVAGGVTICVPFLVQYWMIAVYSFIFGSGIAVFVSLRSIIMVELMGLQKLTNAFGLVVMCQGVSSFLGAPVAGLLSDVTGNYNSSFYVAGLFVLMAGVICLPLRRIARWERRREQERSPDLKT